MLQKWQSAKAGRGTPKPEHPAHGTEKPARAKWEDGGHMQGPLSVVDYNQEVVGALSVVGVSSQISEEH